MDSITLSNEDIIDLTDILEEGKVPDAAPKAKAFSDLLGPASGNSGMSDLMGGNAKNSALDEDLNMPGMNEVDALLQDLQFPEQPAQTADQDAVLHAAVGAAQDDDLDALIDNIMAPEDAPAPKVAPKAPEAFDSLDDLLGASHKPAPAAKAANTDVDAFGSLDELLGASAKPAPAAASPAPSAQEDDLFDLDAALNAAMGEIKTSPAQSAAQSPSAGAAEPALSLNDDFDLDSALNAALGEVPKPAAKPEAAPQAAKAPEAAKTAAAGAGDFDLDSVLNDPFSAPSAPAPKAVAEPAAQSQGLPPDMDLELNALLGEMGEAATKSTPPKPAAAEPTTEAAHEESFVEGRLEVPAPRLQDLERRLEKVSGEMREKNEVGSMGLRALENRLSELEKSGEALTGLEQKIENENAVLEERLALLEHSLTLGDRVSALEGKLNALPAPEVWSKLGELDRIAELSAGLEQLSGRMDALGDAGESPAPLAALEAELENRLKPLDIRLQDLEDQARAEQGADPFPMLDQRVQDLEERLALGVQPEVPGLSALEERLQGFEGAVARIAELEEKLAQAAQPEIPGLDALEERLHGLEGTLARIAELEEKLAQADAANEAMRLRLESLEQREQSPAAPAFSLEDHREELLALVRGEVLAQMMNEENVPPFADNMVRELVALENRIAPLEEGRTETPVALRELADRITNLEDGLKPEGALSLGLVESLSAKADVAAAEAAARIIREEIAALLAEDDDEEEGEEESNA